MSVSRGNDRGRVALVLLLGAVGVLGILGVLHLEYVWTVILVAIAMALVFRA